MFNYFIISLFKCPISTFCIDILTNYIKDNVSSFLCKLACLFILFCFCFVMFFLFCLFVVVGVVVFIFFFHHFFPVSESIRYMYIYGWIKMGSVLCTLSEIRYGCFVIFFSFFFFLFKNYLWCLFLPFFFNINPEW